MVTGRSAASIVAIGECMLELSDNKPGWHLSHGGDVFNTALNLTRLGEDVAFMTVLGDDPFSAGMIDEWRTEGMRLDLVMTAPDRLPGIYAIKTDDAGERSFYYWRRQAPIRDLFRLPDCADAIQQAAMFKTLYLSGITLALFDAAGREALADLARSVRAGGGVVVFDPNYRRKLWQSPPDAQRAMEAIAPLVSHVLATFDDEAALYGDRDPAETHTRWRRAGAEEIVIKLGATGCMIDDGRIVSPAQPLTPVDTTGAGDAFNAGYLAARHGGASMHDAGEFANRLGGIVIGHRGAIIPRSEMPDLAAFLAATGS